MAFTVVPSVLPDCKKINNPKPSNGLFEDKQNEDKQNEPSNFQKNCLLFQIRHTKLKYGDTGAYIFFSRKLKLYLAHNKNWIGLKYYYFFLF